MAFEKKPVKSGILLFCFVLLTLLMLLYHEKAFSYASAGLSLWFDTMIPTLLPFMILSGLLIRMNLSDAFAGLFAPLLAPVFRVNRSCLYCIVIGFLCGFPMGARVIAESLHAGKITFGEADWLLSFCNNIGPIYFTGFVLPLLGIRRPLPYLFGMYGLPFLYGILLRYTVCRHAVPFPDQNFCRSEKCCIAGRAPLSAAENGSACTPGLLTQTDAAVTSALTGIASLGGYMVLFSLLNLLPDCLLRLEGCTKAAAGCLLEITSGISRMAAYSSFPVLVFLPFGGLSCIAQTYSQIAGTGLSLSRYVFHKLVLAAISLGYYSFLLFP